jgi:predicted nucleotidyltransferase
VGKIFTWGEIVHNQIPSLSDFPQVIAEVRRTAETERSLVSVLVCGSVIRGDHTVRSDIDCFVLYDHKCQNEAFAWMQKMSAIADLVHVPLSFIPCDTLIARTRMHHVGPSFAQHLQKSIEAGGLLKGDPLSHIAPSLPEKDELEAYLRIKMYSLQEAWGTANTFSEERMASYLKKLSEAPMHIARKTLVHAGTLKNDSKAYVRSQYRKVMPEGMADQLDELIEYDVAYTKNIPAQRRLLDPKSYKQELQQILDKSDEILAFIRDNLAFVAGRPA